MRRLIAAVVLLVAVLLWHGEAVAECYTNTYILPGGKIVICQVCCYWNNCTTTCF